MKFNDAPLPVRELLRINVIVYRAERRFSQEELAQHSGVSRPTISRIERGMADVGVEIVERLAKALGKCVSELFASPMDGPVDDDEVMRRFSAPRAEFADAIVLMDALDEAAGLKRYSNAGRPPVSRRNARRRPKGRRKIRRS